MPVVPYDPSRSTEAPLPTPARLDVVTPPAAFGAATAAAGEQAGQRIQQGAGELFQTAVQLQTTAAETRAKQGFVDASDRLGAIDADFYAKKGAAAVAARPQYSQDVRQVYQDALDQTQSPIERRFLADALSRRISYSLDDGQRHAGQQQAEYNKEVSNGLVASAVAAAGQHPYSEQMWSDTKDLIRSEAIKQSVQAGLKPDDAGTQVNIDKWTSLAWEHRLQMIGFDNPRAARALYEANKDQIKGITADGTPMSLKIDEWLQGRENVIGTREDAHDILFGGGYNQRLIRKEGGVSLDVKSPTSSATGLYQITQGTWNDIRTRHSELDLPPRVAQAGAEAQTAAINVFTKENRDKLQDAGIPADDKNAYLAHFLGADGAIKFWKGMQDNPEALAKDLADPAQVRANRNVFYNKDGTPKTAVQMYTDQTSSFAGPGTLNADSGPDFLEQALQAGRDRARSLHPDNPQYEDMLLSRINTDYNYFHNAYRQQEFGNFASLASVIAGATGGERITNRDTILSNPVLAQQFNDLGSTSTGKMRQNQLMAMIDNNYKKGSLDPEGQTMLFDRIMGLGIEAEHDPTKRDEFLAMDFGDLSGKLSQGLREKLVTEMDHIKRVWQGRTDALERNNRLAGAMGVLKPMLKDAGLDPNSQDKDVRDRYMQFEGALYRQLTDYENQTQKPLTDQAQINGLGSKILRETESNWVYRNKRAYEVPTAQRAAIEKAFAARPEYNGRTPSPFEVSDIYQKILAMPSGSPARKLIGLD